MKHAAPIAILMAGLIPQLHGQVAGGIGNLITKNSSYMPLIGGPGGGEFKSPCPGGYLTGLVLHAADDVDAVQPVCANPDGKGGGPAGNFAGGRGGRPVQLLCPAAAAVFAMDIAAEGEATVVVNNIHLFCARVEPNARPPASPSAVFDGPAATRANRNIHSLRRDRRYSTDRAKKYVRRARLRPAYTAAPEYGWTHWA